MRMVPDRRASAWPALSTDAISTLTSSADSRDGLSTTANAMNPLGDAAAPTFSSVSAGAGVGVLTGVAVDRRAAAVAVLLVDGGAPAC